MQTFPRSIWLSLALVGFKQLLKRIFLFGLTTNPLWNYYQFPPSPTLYCFHSIIIISIILWCRWLSPWITLDVVSQLKPWYDSIAQWTKNQRYIYLFSQSCSICLQLLTFENFLHLELSPQINIMLNHPKQHKNPWTS